MGTVPKPEKLPTPEGYVTLDDLKAFAEGNGYRAQQATLLWNKMLKRLVPELEYGGREGLDVRSLASPEKKWHPDRVGYHTTAEMAAGAMVSRSSLLAVQSRVFPNVALDYGVQLDRIFQAWVNSMK
jgi:hypothetical protein